MYDPTSHEYAVRGNNIFLKRKKSVEVKKDAYKNKLKSKNSNDKENVQFFRRNTRRTPG